MTPGHSQLRSFIVRQVVACVAEVDVQFHQPHLGHVAVCRRVQDALLQQLRSDVIVRHRQRQKRLGAAMETGELRELRGGEIARRQHVRADSSLFTQRIGRQ